tara:strand:+ start:21828 stop:22328 length:501 start_codon:yes stop_codon:yes gene_type:complete
VTSTIDGKIAASADTAPEVLTDEERRAFSDRRRRPTPMFSRHVLRGGRRRHVRRNEEREGSFVDVHGAGVLFIVLAIVALNLLDAYFTLLFLSYGGTELNPAVQWVLDSTWHPWPFLLMKTVGIGIACAFLMMAKHFRPARIGLAFVLLGYSVLLGWHLFLLQYLP